MPTITLEFPYTTGLTLSVKAYAQFSDTELASQPAAEATNRKGVYTVTFSLPVGNYRYIASSGANPVVTDMFSVAATDSLVLGRGEAEPTIANAARSGPVGVGDYPYSHVVLNGLVPTPDVRVYVTTDALGVNKVAGDLLSNSSGVVTFYLNAEDYYLWEDPATSFGANPIQITVTDNSDPFFGFYLSAGVTVVEAGSLLTFSVPVTVPETLKYLEIDSGVVGSSGLFVNGVAASEDVSSVFDIPTLDKTQQTSALIRMLDNGAGNTPAGDYTMEVTIDPADYSGGDVLTFYLEMHELGGDTGDQIVGSPVLYDIATKA